MPGRISSLYDHPGYYELAFSYRDIPREVDCFEQCFELFSKVPLKRVLELACGPSPHLREICRRGYTYIGIDLNSSMLDVARRKAQRQSLSASFQQASMVQFEVKEPVEFVFVALGSLYVSSEAELKQHFVSVGKALRPGGLYLMDWCVQFGEQPSMSADGDSWEMALGDIVVKAYVKLRWFDQKSLLLEEEVALEVDDAGQHHRLVSTDRKRAIYPQDLLRLIAEQPDLEFVGWWNNWNLNQPLALNDTGARRPIVLIRRRLA